MDFKRRSGILLHPTSLPDTPGIGTLGEQAFKFIDWLCEADQSLWQILPLGPTGYGDSPYASFSTFAGNPLIIDLEQLALKGWADKKEIAPPEYIKKAGNIDFGAVVWWKMPVLKKCAIYFVENASAEDKEKYKLFCKESAWLDMYAVFMSIKSVYDKKAEEEKPESSMWNRFWPTSLARCEKDAVAEWKKSHKDDIEIFKIIQFFFDVQWKELKSYANDSGIKLIGDIPIFVAPDSADVWANQEFFQLDKDGRPVCVSGVPPDYFCADGQLWGNPLYDWDKMKTSGYSWWIKRIRRAFELVDVLRIDHFRGFEAYWSVPADAKTAKNGKWVKCPGDDLFKTIKKKLGDMPFIAEDLGVITDEVRELRDNAGLPGMKVFQFGFSADEARENGMVNCFLPHMYDSSKCVVYTGTHDNDTMQGWLENLNEQELLLVAQYIEGKELSLEKAKSLVKSGALRKEIIKSVISSNAVYAVIPMQDILGIGNEGKMNTPATTGSNWTWRMDKKDFKSSDAKMLTFFSELYGRNL